MTDVDRYSYYREKKEGEVKSLLEFTIECVRESFNKGNPVKISIDLSSQEKYRSLFGLSFNNFFKKGDLPWKFCGYIKTSDCISEPIMKRYSFLPAHFQ